MINSQSKTSIPSKFSTYVMIIGVCLTTFLDSLDLSIINVSLPEITSSFGQTVFDGTWIIATYAVGNVISLCITSQLAKKIGAVNLMIYSLIGFILFSALAGLSQFYFQLIITRLIQGFCAGPLLPLSQAMFKDYVPNEKKSFAIAMWGIMSISGPLMGPILGGLITETMGWRWLFYINVPFGMISLVMIVITLYGKDTERAPFCIDLKEFIFLVLFLLGIQFGIDLGREFNWFDSSIVIGLFILAFFSFFIFLTLSLTNKIPILKMEVFLNPGFRTSAIVFFLSFVIMNIQGILYPIWLQTQMGYTPFKAGIALIPLVIPSIIFGPLVLKTIKSSNAKLYMYSGFIISVLSLLQAAGFNTESSFASLWMTRFWIGLGNTVLSVSIMLVGLSSVRDEDFVDASCILSFIRIFSVSIASSLGVSYLDYQNKIFFEVLQVSINNTNPNVASTIDKLQNVGYNYSGAIAWIDAQVGKQSFTLGLNQTIYLLTFLLVFLLPFILKMKIPKSIKIISGE